MSGPRTRSPSSNRFTEEPVVIGERVSLLIEGPAFRILSPSSCFSRWLDKWGLFYIVKLWFVTF